MSTAPPAPDQPLRISTTGLAKAEDFKKLLSDLGPRVGLRSGHQGEAAKPEVKVRAPTKTLAYFQPDKTSGVAKVSDLARVHQLLLKAVPAGVTRPFRARRNDGTLKRKDLHAFHKHWLAVLRAENETAESSS